MEKQYNTFFEDIDNTKKKSCLKSCFWVFLFVLVLSVISFAVLYVYATKETTPETKIEYNQEAYDKLMDNLLVLENPTQPQTLEIDSQSLTSLLIKAFEEKQQYVSAIQGKISNEGVELFSRTDKPLQTSIFLTVLPTVEKNKLHLAIKRVQIGQLAMPQFLMNFFNQSLEKRLEKATSENTELFLRSIEIQENKAILSIVPQAVTPEPVQTTPQS